MHQKKKKNQTDANNITSYQTHQKSTRVLFLGV